MLDMLNIYENEAAIDEKNKDELVGEIEKAATVDFLEIMAGTHGIGLAVEAVELIEELESTDNENEITVENKVIEVSKKKRKKLSARDAVGLSK